MTACSCPTTPSSTCRTNWLACRASAMSRSSVPASMPCASGWIRPAAGARPDAAGCHQRRAAAEPGGDGRPGRHTAGAEGSESSSTRSTSTDGSNDAADYENIIVKVDQQNGGRITRIRDIGRVELGAQTYSQSFMQNGRPAAGIGIFQLPEANAIAVAQEVDAKMAELSKSFPPGLDLPRARSTRRSSSRLRSTRSTSR